MIVSEVRGEKQGVNFDTFALDLALHQDNFEMFIYLWEKHNYFWNQKHLEFVVSILRQNKEKVNRLFSSNATHIIFKSISPSERLLFVKSFMFTEETVDEGMVQIMKQAPYAGAVLAIVASGYPNHPF